MVEIYKNNFQSQPLIGIASGAIPRGSLLSVQFSIFNQHYTYFHVPFHLHIFSQNNNNIIRNCLQVLRISIIDVSYQVHILAEQMVLTFYSSLSDRPFPSNFVLRIKKHLLYFFLKKNL